MWKLKVKINDGTALMRALPDPVRLLTFLRHRSSAKSVLLECLLQFCRQTNVRVAELGDALDVLNREYRRHMEDQMRRQMALPASTLSSAKQVLSRVVGGGSGGTYSPLGSSSGSRPLAKVIVDQADLFASLFSPLLEDPEVPGKKVIRIIMEYYRGLRQYEVMIYCTYACAKENQ